MSAEQINAAVEAWLNAPSGDQETNDRLAEAIMTDLDERLTEGSTDE